MEEFETYLAWIEKLQDIASLEGVTLFEDKRLYYPYFVRGWSPDSVISMIVAGLISPETESCS